MKKALSILLVLALLATGLAAGVIPETDALPQVGDKVEGFVVKEVRDFAFVGGTGVLFEHERTGAHLLYIANSDTNRVFDLTFFTRAIDNTGLPHVFEHATLNGSAKYPSPALFFNLSFQTYNTFMNAFTYPLMTTYPVASLSEEQLLKYADFYTDSCLHPSIMEDESIYREEAWRYRMASMEDALTLEGTVYSEMLGALTMDSQATYNMLRSAYPGSMIGNISGGDPAYIPDMTWESLKVYHDLYYHPSNCMAYLYGEFADYTAFLKILDEAFAPYERKEFDFEDAGYTPLTEPVELSFAFPMEAGASTENRSSVYYAFVCPGLKDDPQEELILNTLTDLLAADASPLMQSLKKALPSGSFLCYIETEGPDDSIAFVAKNVNPGDAQTFKTTVDTVLADAAENGFTQDLVDSVMSSLSMTVKLTREDSGVGVNLIPNIAYSHASSGDPFNYLDYVENLDKIDEWNAQGLYAQAVGKWLLDSSSTALVTTYPEPGLREQLDAAEAERLAEVKSSMSEEELQAIIDQTNAEKVADDASAYVAQLQAVTVESLPEEIREYTVNDAVGEDGVRRMTAAAGVDGVGQVMLLMDASGLPQDAIHWFALYTSLLGEMDTDAHTSEELSALKARYLYNAQIRLSLVNTYGSDEFCPYLRAGWIAADEDLEAGYALIDELLYHTQFTDAEKLLGFIQRSKAALKSDITSNPYTALLYRELGANTPLYAYYNYFNFLDYYNFLDQVEQLMAQSPETVAAYLAGVQQYFHNRTNAIAAYAGSEDGIACNAPLADAFMASLDAEPIEAQTYVFETPAKNEALIVDSSVQFNCMASDYAAMGLEKYSADLDAVSALVTDLYLFPMLREQYGVYTPLHGFVSDVGPYFIAYRDPNVRETFAVYDALPDFVAGLELDQDTLDGYILSSYSVYAMPDGELSGAIMAISSRLSQEPEDLKIQYMQQLKALTPEKVEEYAEYYAQFMQNAYRFTAGGAGAINANADLYDQILNPFGSVDASQVTFDDAEEGSEHYDAVRFVFENMLMSPKEEGRFGVDDEATLGELSGMLYAFLGGDVSAQEEALGTLAQYGIVPADGTVETAISAADVEAILTNFGTAAGIPYEADGEAVADTAMTRGELAETMMNYVLTYLS